MGRKVLTALTALSIALPAGALEIKSTLDLELSITSVYQSADFFKDARGSADKGSVAADLGLNFHPTPRDEAQITLSFAAGNGLKNTFADKGFALMPNADDLEDDLKNINGRNRDYLLEAWYKHTFQLRGWEVSPTVGIIDATAYIDDNEYANDELTQFMNDAFVNNPVAELPSYDLGAVAELSKNGFSLRGLVMNPKGYHYYAFQAAIYGEDGNYRLYYYRTDKAFETPSGKKDYKEGVGFSADGPLTENLGVFLRLGTNTNTSTGDFKNFASGGVVYDGLRTLGKPSELGAGYAYLEGNEKISGIESARVGELYYKITLDEYTQLTFDLQYQKQKNTDGTLGAWTYGVRLNASF